MDNETKISVSFKNSVTNANKLDKYAKQLKEIYSVLSAIDKGQLAQLGEFNVTLTKVKDNTQSLEKKSSKFAKNMNTAFSIGKLSLFGRQMYSLIKGMSTLTSKSASYVENLNLLEVAYANINRKTGEFNEDIKVTSGRIEKLINNMSQVYGLDESDLTRTFGIFKQLANAMELPTETAENLSELMVKMRQDIASLYNLDLSRAGNALQSALAGQVRPIRSATGADITEKTLQKTVDALGLDTTISKLSFVEKRLIMVISLTNQLKNSQGDYGRTIESVSNQVKVFHDQWDRLSRAMGNIFYPIMKRILPVVNGILMALTEIANIIASLLGFKLDEFDYSGLAGVSDATLDLEENLDGAGDSVDKLKKKLSGLRSFDKLNVITTPSDSGKSSGGVSGGINPKILEAFNSAFSNYDDMLGKVRMKANDIRDSIMEWLGFTKQINPLTGEIEWSYGGISKTFSNMLTSFSKLSFPVRTVVSSLVLLSGAKMISGISSLLKMLGGATGLTAVLKKIKDENILMINPIKETGELWGQTATKVQKLTTALIGAGGLYLGFTMIDDAMDSISDKGLTLGNSLELLGGTISNVLGGAMLLGAINPALAPLGAMAGLVMSIVEGFGGMKSEEEKFAEQFAKDLKPIKEYNDELARQFKIIDENAELLNTQVGVHQNLFNELQNIVDENGKVQRGYEDRAEFIVNELNKAYGLEIEYVDGVIKEYDKQKDAIQKVIDKKKIEAQVNIANQKYELAIKEQTKAYENMSEAERKFKEIQDKVTEAQKNNKWALKELLPQYAEAKKALEDSRTQYDKTQNAILVYSNVLKASEEGNVQEVEYWTNRLLQEHEKQGGSYTKLAEEAEASYQSRKKQVEETGKEITELDKANFDEMYNNLITTLKNEKDAIYDNEDDYVNAWKQVALHSKDMFMDGIDDLPDDIKSKVISKMYGLGTEVDNELQRGLDKYTPYIKFKTNLPDVASTVNKFAGELKNSNLGKSDLLNLGGSSKVFANPYKFETKASGGMPKVGNVFFMNEKEPELLGTIGGKTFVANQTQMMDLLDKKIGNAQNNSKPQVINLYLDADHKIGSYTMEQLQNMAKTDGKPITIG